MPTVLQFRRGTTTQNNNFTGTAGELSVDTTLDTVRVHDGSTAGGFALLKETGISNLTLNAQAEIRLGDSDSSNYVGFKSPGTVGTNLIFTLPSSDGSAGQALVTDASGTLSFAAAGATITSDTSTDTDFLLYFASTTSGALTAVKQDSGLIYNPSTGSLSSAVFIGALTGNASTATTAATLTTTRAIEVSGAVTGTANFDGSAAINIVTTNTADPTITLAGDLSGSVTLTNLASGTLTATVGTLNQSTTGSAATLTTTRAIEVSGAVTGTANFDGSAAINIVTTATSDPTITLTGAVTGAGTLTNLGSVSIATTNTADPTITLGGDLSGSVTLTNLASGTLTATIAANSVALGTDTTGNYVAAGAVSGTGLSGSASAEGATFTVTSNATSANTASTIVARDGSGNFTAGTITANLTGVASSVTSQANSATIGAATSNTADRIVLRDASGNFSAGVITATATAARYADLAEKYTSDENYDPGTVLELGGIAEVTQTRRPTSLAIAGIVSTDPAYLMNSDSEGISVALIGRVPCKVTGKINKGDILVSSDIPGHAKAHREIHNPPAGSMIGKAIEAKDNDGPGVIEVLVGRM